MQQRAKSMIFLKISPLHHAARIFGALLHVAAWSENENIGEI
jgi:hypothetical protein